MANYPQKKKYQVSGRHQPPGSQLVLLCGDSRIQDLLPGVLNLDFLC